MRRARGLDDFVRNPVGTWILAGPSIAWCASPSLGGATYWGAVDAAGARQALEPFACLWSEGMEDCVDVVLDASVVEHLEPAAVDAIIDWYGAHREGVVGHVRHQVGVPPRGTHGVTLSGILPLIGETHPFRIVRDALEAHRLVDPAEGEARCALLNSLVATHSRVPAVLRSLRELLRQTRAAVDLAEAARALGLSARSFQRSLAECGRSFQQELRDARFTEAREALASSDEKVVAIAHRLGISEGALTQLVRERAGCTPSELRRSLSKR